ncbi:MAG: hypothetical protein ACFFFT_13975 [Candidatus Thorarchaeota archaeon]
MSEKKGKKSENELDDLLDQAFERQELIHRKCKMRDDPVIKQAEWNKKYGK